MEAYIRNIHIKTKAANSKIRKEFATDERWLLEITLCISSPFLLWLTFLECLGIECFSYYINLNFCHRNILIIIATDERWLLERSSCSIPKFLFSFPCKVVLFIFDHVIFLAYLFHISYDHMKGHTCISDLK